jgi:hypothetical protein
MKMARFLNHSYFVFYSVMLALYIYLGVRAVAICRQRLQPEILPPIRSHQTGSGHCCCFGMLRVRLFGLVR